MRVAMVTRGESIISTPPIPNKQYFPSKHIYGNMENGKIKNVFLFSDFPLHCTETRKMACAVWCIFFHFHFVAGLHQSLVLSFGKAQLPSGARGSQGQWTGARWGGGYPRLSFLFLILRETWEKKWKKYSTKKINNFHFPLSLRSSRGKSTRFYHFLM